MKQAFTTKIAQQAIIEADSNAPQAIADVLVRIAGVIAHDLNNALMVISSYCELMLDKMPAEDPHRSYVERVQTAGHKAMKIGATLSAFSRPHTMSLDAFDFDATVAELAPVLAGVVGERQMLTHPAWPGTRVVSLPRPLVTQLVVAIVAAARDALPCGGSVDLRTGLVTRLQPTDACSNLDEADYALMSIAICQSGVQCDRSHCKGTTLASIERKLACVRNVVECHGGKIVVCADIDRGVVITMYLPLLGWGEEKGGTVSKESALLSGASVF